MDMNYIGAVLEEPPQSMMVGWFLDQFPWGSGWIISLVVHTPRCIKVTMETDVSNGGFGQGFEQSAHPVFMAAVAESAEESDLTQQSGGLGLLRLGRVVDKVGPRGQEGGLLCRSKEFAVSDRLDLRSFGVFSFHPIIL